MLPLRTSSCALRLNSRTSCPRASRASTVARPTTPVPPVTRTLTAPIRLWRSVSTWQMPGHGGVTASSSPSSLERLPYRALRRSSESSASDCRRLRARGVRTWGRQATYTIASASPANEAYGLMARQGTQLAVDVVNKRGGIRSHRLALVSVDDEGTGAPPPSSPRQLVDADTVLAVVGHANSSATVPPRACTTDSSQPSRRARARRRSPACRHGCSVSSRAIPPTASSSRVSRRRSAIRAPRFSTRTTAMAEGSPTRFAGHSPARSRRSSPCRRWEGGRTVPGLPQAPRARSDFRRRERRLRSRDPS